MDSADLQVLDTLVAWIDAGRQVMLLTVAATWGSAPRPVGAWAALDERGMLVGSVSGGCVEDDVMHRVRAGLPATPQVWRYGVTADEAARFGLPCGGTLELVAEPRPDVTLLRELRRHCREGRVSRRTLDVASGRVTLEPGAPPAHATWDGRLLTTVHGPRWRLLVIGAGQVTSFLVPMARALDYDVTVCDPRPEYQGAWQAEGARLVTDMPDDAVLALRPDAHTAIVALTHDPKLDDLALLEALRSQAFYVGALGSRRNTERRKARLAEHFGLTPEELARLHGPVGLPIGSRLPAEIAVAIAAEMVAVRHAGQAPVAPSDVRCER